MLIVAEHFVVALIVDGRPGLGNDVLVRPGVVVRSPPALSAFRWKLPAPPNDLPGENALNLRCGERLAVAGFSLIAVLK
jgi:hypothetical protein